MLATRTAFSSTKASRNSIRISGTPKRILINKSNTKLAAGSECVESADVTVPLADRRALMMGFAALGLFGQVDVASAMPDGYTKFVGLASPPSIYGGSSTGYEKPKYTFEYPLGWKVATISKVEKGMQGIDCRVENTKIKGQQAFVVSLGRAGEDGKSFKLRDLESTFAGFAGADYNLQDSLIGAIEIKTSERTDESGDIFYEYDIDSPEFRYLASIAVKNGIVFALFCRSPSRTFKDGEDTLRYILSTFTLLPA